MKILQSNNFFVIVIKNLLKWDDLLLSSSSKEIPSIGTMVLTYPHDTAKEL